jgi:hypothetical protein
VVPEHQRQGGGAGEAGQASEQWSGASHVSSIGTGADDLTPWAGPSI